MATPPIPSLSMPVDSDDHVRGDVDRALVVLVEYGDFECPHCGQARRFLDTLRNRHGDDLAVVWRHLPLPELHPHAQAAAYAAEAAARQGRFWDMHDWLFDHSRALDDEGLLAAATALNLDLERFAADVAAPSVAARVQRDRDGAESVGLLSTPGFYLGDDLLLEPWPTLRTRIPELIRASREQDVTG